MIKTLKSPSQSADTSIKINATRFVAGALIVLAQVSGIAAVSGTIANGESDDTAAIQRAINTLGDHGVLDGDSAVYLVGRLDLKSNMTFQNFQFVTRPSGTPFTVPVTLDGTTIPIRNVTIRNVHVDGNRREQSGLIGNEDGGRDCFRIVGKASNIWIVSSSGRNCATDGLKIFSADRLTGDDAVLNFQNIYVIDSTFDNNRRHGASGDSLLNVNFIMSRFRGNGLASGNGVTEGERAYLVDGMLYGAGLVLEGYNVGSRVAGLTVAGCTHTGNARFGIQFWQPVLQTRAFFLPWSDIRIESSTLDGGVSWSHGRQALEFNLPPANTSAGVSYRGITLSNNTILNGIVTISNTDGIAITSGSIASPYQGFWGISSRSRNVIVNSVATGGKILAVN